MFELATRTRMRAFTMRAILMCAFAVTLGALTAPAAHATTAGVDWAPQSTPLPDTNWSDITYGNGVFVAVGSAGAGHGPLAMTSRDGVNWTGHPTTPENYWMSVTYGNGLFVAVASDNTGVAGSRVMTSPDGATWTLRTSPIDTSVNIEPRWTSVEYANGTFVAVSDRTTAMQVMTSTDGINWTLSDAPARKAWVGLTFGNGKFVAVAMSDTTGSMTSTDGINWTLGGATLSSCWDSVAYGNDVFVAVTCSSTATPVMTSPDGVTWTLRNGPTGMSLQNVTFGGGQFVAVSDFGARVMTSTDGITWTTQVAPTCSWFNATYGNGLFVAIAYTGSCSGSLAMTSGALQSSAVADASEWVLHRQALPMPETGSCADLAGHDAHVSYGTGLTGGWVRSWEPWVNPTLDSQGNRIGGWACTRTVIHDGPGWHFT